MPQTEYVTDAPEAPTVELDVSFQEAQSLQAEREAAKREREDLEAEAEAILAQHLDGWEGVKDNGLSLETTREAEAKADVKEKVRRPFKDAVDNLEESVILEANGVKAKVYPVNYNGVSLQNV